MRKKWRTATVSVLLAMFILTGCGMSGEKESAEPITVYLWSMTLYDQYAPYIQSMLPEVNIQFVIGQNDLSFYQFMDDNGCLPDIIMCRRFSRHDALPLKDHLLDLSTTENAGAVYENYLRDFTNSDGTINWLPVCGTADGIIANRALFEEYGIPLPTDYESFVSACQKFEELGIRGFLSDFIYDYTCMEILQGISIPEITSMEGSMWRSSYEDPEGEETGLDDTVWPGVFQNMEQFIKEVGLRPSDLMDTVDYGLICEMFENNQIAMIRDGADAVIRMNKSGMDTVFLPYFGKNGEQWILTYPEFQVALNKDLEKNSSRKETALKVFEVMLSEDAQKILADKGDVISYYKNVDLKLPHDLKNLKPLIEQNHSYIRVASNDFFSASKDVIHKMIRGEYDAKEAYEEFDRQLTQSKKEEEEKIFVENNGYSNMFHVDGGSESYSVMANTVRTIYESDVLVVPAFGFCGQIMASDYTEQQVENLVLHGLFAYCGEMKGAELKSCVQGYVEGKKGSFQPFNRGSLPIVSGIEIEVEEMEGAYRLISITKDGEAIRDNDTFRVVCLNTESYMEPYLKMECKTFQREELLVKIPFTEYIKAGGKLEKPQKYIKVRVTE